jgi:hypothetical protein
MSLGCFRDYINVSLSSEGNKNALYGKVICFYLQNSLMWLRKRMTLVGLKNKQLSDRGM